MMEWKRLLTPQRLGKQAPEDLQLDRTCFQKDCDRIVFSSPFRRLKDKTQVYSLSKNDYIRTRLIHSLEVSCVGRSLGRIVGYEVVKRHQVEKYRPLETENTYHKILRITDYISGMSDSYATTLFQKFSGISIK